MKRIENHCVGCKDLGMFCFGDSCSNKNVTCFYCDRCGAEAKLYHCYGEELCEECVLDQFEVVDGSDEY